MDYACIFGNSKICNVRQAFKLTPESLVEFCQLCDKTNTRTSTSQDAQMIVAIFSSQMQQQQNTMQQFMAMQQSTLNMVVEMVKAVVNKPEKTSKNL